PVTGQVLEFPYDWRLAIEFNARRLARESAQHLRQWRRTVPSARLTFVDHSMGGLLVRGLGLSDIAGGGAYPLDIGNTITIGTPFYGSVKAAMILGIEGGGGLVQRRLRARLRDVARTMPGVYDLLPGYRCVVRKDGVAELTTDDVGAMGADPDLAQ